MSKEYPSIQPIACVNGLVLKVIAIVSMLIDHIGAVLFPGQMVLRDIGRLAFPIFVFLLVEGFIYTKNVRRFEIRLLIFALISEIPFDLAFSGIPFDFQYQNVFFTLLLGVIMLDIITTVRSRMGDSSAYSIFVELVILAAFVAIAFLMKTDYSGGGILLIYSFYRFREYPVLKYALMAAITYLFYVNLEMFAMLAVILLLLYNGKRGFRQDGIYSGARSGVSARLLQYLFYIFYPAHLLIIYFIFLAIR